MRLKMTLISITDPDDPRVAAFRHVKERDLTGREGRFIAEGKGRPVYVVFDPNCPYCHQLWRSLREVADAGATRYRVLLPPAASREEAQATVKRIVAAGVSDYYIMAQGEEANAIALGQYRNREGADRRLAALSAAGFKATMVASGGDGSAQWWLDATLADGTGAAAVRQRTGAAQQRSLECARLR